MHTAAFQREWAHAVGLLKPWWAHTKAAAWVVATAVGQVGDHGIASVCAGPLEWPRHRRQRVRRPARDRNQPPGATGVTSASGQFGCLASNTATIHWG
ncbi:hypothetical protein Aca07nite_20280 [Actinoplanes capillaceus]|uniref:Uncharacterized protein n=1 Tax=Actinoplanes campanulatus TaxID=113559 RepID=A0ABQ3WER6_9ACTN|nr:hypothetical protein Aca07nite_20280 [Actinoplanes capillaceus]